MIDLPIHIRRAIQSGPVPVIRDWRNINYSEMTTGEMVCAFIERHIVIPEGSHVGKKVKLDLFQVAFILSVYDNPNKTKLAIFSVARKNAKTALVAFIMLAHLVGPLASRNSRLNSGALSRQQASEVFSYASKSVQLSPTLRSLVRVVPSQKIIIGLAANTEYRALSSDAGSNHGLSPIVCIMDEIGQIKGPQSDFLDALTTAQAAHDSPLMYYISTQAPTDADLLSIAIDDAKLNKPLNTVCHVYAAEPECEVMDEKQWQYANPALGIFRSETDMRAQAEKADRMPSFRNTFKNLLLNMRIASFATYMDIEEWRKNNGQPKPLDECVSIYGGLDLSSHKDLTSLVLVGECDEGLKHVYAKFWTPRAGLIDREKSDKSPYSLWESQGYLTVVDGATIDYEYVAQDIAEWLSDLGVESSAIAFDRWRINIFKKALEHIQLELPLIEFGQGFKDMAPALDSLESMVLAGALRHGDNPLLNMCAINAVAVSDAAGNRKLEKRKATGRIDGMVALAMAVGVISKESAEPEKKYQMFVL